MNYVPLHKTIVLVRHAESEYNAHKASPMNWITLKALSDPMLYDPQLSPKGVQQLRALMHSSLKHDLLNKTQLVIVSPLRRAIDTSLAILCSRDDDQQLTAAPLHTDTLASIPKLRALKVPVLVSPLCTEILDTSADIGSSPEILSSNYPLLDFTALESAWWYHRDVAQPRAIDDEPPARVRSRVEAFKRLLAARSENFIIVVTHSSFIRHCTGEKFKIPNCAMQECALEVESKSGDLRLRVVQRLL